MSSGPETSITLIKAIAGHPECARWTEFYHKYASSIKAYIAANYSSVDPDDILQTTMISLMKALPDYVYLPDERGHFRNYVLGIAKNKAIDAIRKNMQRQRVINKVAAEEEGTIPEDPIATKELEDRSDWEMSLLEAAIEQMLSRPGMSTRNRIIFQRLMLSKESADNVARDLNIERNNVYQIKARMKDELARLMSSMAAAAGDKDE